MTRKSCAVGMRNEILRNYLKLFIGIPIQILIFLLAMLTLSLGRLCLDISAWCAFKITHVVLFSL